MTSRDLDDLDDLAELALALIVAPTTDHDPGDEDRS